MYTGTICAGEKKHNNDWRRGTFPCTFEYLFGIPNKYARAHMAHGNNVELNLPRTCNDIRFGYVMIFAWSSHGAADIYIYI